MKKILMPVDVENVSDKTIDLTCEMVEKLDSKLVILSVVPFTDMMSHPQLSNMLDMRDEKFVEYAEKIVNDIKLKFSLKNIEAETIVIKGNPADEIVKYAESENFDMIIMNTQNANSAKRFFVGSVTTKVIHHSEIPVLVIR